MIQPFSRRRALSLLAAPAFAAPQTPPSTSAGGSDADVFSISRNQPAATFEDTMPVGNSTLGASVFGAIDRERIALNECTLWSGEPKDWNNPGAKAVLPQVRRLLFAGKFKEAEQLCLRMQGPYTQSLSVVKTPRCLEISNLHSSAVCQPLPRYGMLQQ